MPHCPGWGRSTRNQPHSWSAGSRSERPRSALYRARTPLRGSRERAARKMAHRLPLKWVAKVGLLASAVLLAASVAQATPERKRRRPVVLRKRTEPSTAENTTAVSRPAKPSLAAYPLHTPAPLRRRRQPIALRPRPCRVVRLSSCKIGRLRGPSDLRRCAGLTRRQAHRAAVASKSTQVIEKIGAGEGNRTLVISLEGCCSTIELHPRTPSDTCARRSRDRSGGRMVVEVGLEPTKAFASGFTVRPLCHSGHSTVRPAAGTYVRFYRNPRPGASRGVLWRDGLVLSTRMGAALRAVLRVPEPIHCAGFRRPL